MHERTERAIARLLFVFCCAVPTLITLLVILVTWTPWYHNHKLREIRHRRSLETGLVFQAEDYQRVSPSKLTTSDVTLSNPETGSEIAWVREITWLTEPDQVSALLHQPKIQASQLESIWHLIHDQFLCRPDRTEVPFDLSANDLTIHSASGDITLDVDVRVDPSENRTTATFKCFPAWAKQNSPILITVTRDRSPNVDAPTTQWVLETGNSPLPCAAISDYLPFLKRLGPDAEFSGVLKWDSSDLGQWSVDFSSSRFTHIELSRLFEDVPHRFTGTAELHLTRCVIQPDEKVNVTGSFIAHDGWIGQSFLASLQTHLGFGISNAALSGPRADIPYGRCALHFGINDSLMNLEGTCGNLHDYAGVAICNSNEAIAQTTEINLPTSRLLSVLSSAHSELVPISEQTRGLINLLIAPDGRLQPASNVAPESRISNAKDWSGGEPIRQR